MKSQDNPLMANVPKEVPLEKSPLIRVIAQMRFPLIISIQKQDYIASFQEAIRESYPILRSEIAQQIQLGPHGVSAQESKLVWRFHDQNGEWRVSLAPDFIALETTSYKTRGDFLSRLETVIKALSEHIEPKIVERLGLRYIDRVTGDALENIKDLVRPDVLGALAELDFQHYLSDSFLKAPKEEAVIHTRWGRIPPGSTIDPAACEPIKEPSWILDLDMFSTEQQPLIVKELMDQSRRYAERIYTFFRWVVTDDFLRKYGGKL